MRRLHLVISVWLITGPPWAPPAAAQWQPQSTLKAALPPVELEFSANDGWSSPEVGQDGNPHAIVIRFADVPEDAVTRIGYLLFDRFRNAFDLVQMQSTERGPRLLLRSRRPLTKAGVTWQKRTKSWTVRLELGALDPLPGAHYAALMPAGSPAQAAMYAVESAELPAMPRCEDLVAHAKHSAPWAAWVRLRLADCWRLTGRRNDAILSLRSLATSVHTPPAVVSLASMRLEEWPETWNPHETLPWPKRREAMALPGPVLQELSLRAARHLLYRGRGHDASRFLQTAVKRRMWDTVLRQEADLLRLELMYYFAEHSETASLISTYELAPPPLPQEPAAPGMARLAGLAYARVNRMPEAEVASAQLLAAGDGWIDPELVLALHAGYVRARDDAHARVIASRLPANLQWLEGLVERGLVSAPLSEEIATWLIEMQPSVGSPALARVVGPLNAFDGARGLSETRLLMLVEAMDCQAIEASAPAITSTDWPLFAAFCRLGTSDDAGLERVWALARRDPMAGSDSLTQWVEAYAEARHAFMARFGDH